VLFLWLEDGVKVDQLTGHQESSSFLAGDPGDGTEGCDRRDRRVQPFIDRGEFKKVVLM
jgi:hypothetical protein